MVKDRDEANETEICGAPVPGKEWPRRADDKVGRCEFPCGHLGLHGFEAPNGDVTTWSGEDPFTVSILRSGRGEVGEAAHKDVD